jgi:hypothetical protein
MRRGSALLLLLCACAGLVGAYEFCGDGVAQYATEGCDAGMRLVVRNNTLAYSGIMMGGAPTKQLNVTFRYSVIDYRGVGVRMPIFAFSIVHGSDAPEPVDHAYWLVCTEPQPDQMRLEVERDHLDPIILETRLLQLQWQYAGMTCDEWMTMPPAWTADVGVLTAFSAVWIGDVVGRKWSLALADATSTFAPNTIKGTTCCSAQCARTTATAFASLCYDAQTTASLAAGDAPWMCQPDGACSDRQWTPRPVQPSGSVHADAAEFCGNAVLDPGEECDDGLYKIDFVVPAANASLWTVNGVPTLNAEMHLQLDFAINRTLGSSESASYGPGSVTGLIVNATGSTAPFTSFTIAPESFAVVCNDSPPDNIYGSQIVIFVPGNTGATTIILTFSWIDFEALCPTVSAENIYEKWMFHSVYIQYTDDSTYATYISFDASDAPLPMTRGTLCCTANCTVPSPVPTQQCINETQAISPRPGPQFCSSNGVCTWDWSSPSLTGTLTPSQTPSNTASQTRSPSATPTKSQSSTPSVTAPVTQSRSQSLAPTPAMTKTAGASPSNTASNSKTGTGTRTNTPSNTQTRTPSPTSSQTPTLPTPPSTVVPSESHTVTQTSTMTRTPTPSNTQTGSPSHTGTPTPSNTASITPSPSETPTQSPTSPPTPSSTRSASQTPTQTQTSSNTATNTPTSSNTATQSPSAPPDPPVPLARIVAPIGALVGLGIAGGLAVVALAFFRRPV